MFALSQCEASQAFTSIKKTGRSSRHRREDGMQIMRSLYLEVLLGPWLEPSIFAFSSLDEDGSSFR